MEDLDNHLSIKKIQYVMRVFSLLSWLLPKEQRKQIKDMRLQMGASDTSYENK